MELAAGDIAKVKLCIGFRMEYEGMRMEPRAEDCDREYWDIPPVEIVGLGYSE